jgi:hypothetical protein
VTIDNLEPGDVAISSQGHLVHCFQNDDMDVLYHITGSNVCFDDASPSAKMKCRLIRSDDIVTIRGT